MEHIRQITYGTPEYEMTLALRNKVMRKPLGLDIYTEDFSFERDCIIVGAFDGETLTAMGDLSRQGDVFKLEYLCVDSEIQSRGLGGRILRHLEQIAAERGGTALCMDARVSAQGFYEQAGYRPVGEVYLLDYAPVPHIRMEKPLR